MDNTIFNQVKQVLVDNLKIDGNDIVPSAELTNDLGINSLELADLVLICEDEFDVEINTKKASKFRTVGDVVAYLETLV
ncbi:MAG: acyl carrier protein [Oscillospiraceae bacterium]|nr:acyl carrier protein [Oscillospiraceae bacterium]